MISMEEAEDIRRTMEAFGLPVSVSGLAWEDVRTAMKSDKKMDSGVVKFILLKEIGQAVIDRTLSDEEIRAGFEFLQGEL